MKSDSELHQDLLAQLGSDPSIRNEDIAVAVKEGVVTLAGTVDSYAQRRAAEQVAERVRGVRAVVNDLKVSLPGAKERSDPDIAHAALNALKWDVQVPEERLRLKVTNGWITLEGEVDWNYEREAADQAVRNLIGVKGVVNLIAVRQCPVPGDVKQRIKEMLKRQAEVDADQITVEVEDHRVTLRGTVRSLPEKRDAAYAAWNAPGVATVDNRLTVSPGIGAVV